LEEFIHSIRTACAHPLFRCGQVDPQTHAEKREYLSPELMAQKFLAAYETVVEIGR
jgi:hypothetical protein